MATINGGDVLMEVKQFLRMRLFSHQIHEYDYKPSFLNEAVRTVTQLLEQSIQYGEGNSLLLIGPRGVGKSWVLETALSTFNKQKSNFIQVYLNGFVHIDDHHALLEIARQLDVESDFGDEVSLSFAASLNYMLEGLRSGNKNKQCVIFILDEFDLFTQHKNQTLLYNLFDICQSPVNPVAVIGLTCRLDVTELLEKRVKSRYSHRHLHLFPNYKFEDYIKIFKSLLHLPSTFKYGTLTYCQDWNKHIDDLSRDQVVLSLLKKQFQHSSDLQSLKTLLAGAVIKLGQEGHSQLSVTLLQEGFQACPHSHDSKLTLITDLSILELSLLVASKHVVELQQDALNFELIYQEYDKFVSKQSHNVQIYSKPIIFKALRKLVSLEFLYPISESSHKHTMMEYCPLRLMLDGQQIVEGVQAYHNCPTDLYYWASSTAMA